ncbi:MAG TPA: response regulator [Verrucomicrobiae bacterium]|jgi:signal transduction histidine kinase
MKPSLRILHLEDDPGDAALVQSVLEAEGLGCAAAVAGTRDEFAAALERGGFDLILSDFSLPGFDGMAALKIARASCPSVPFIFVSGTLGEERAIESLKSGAADYVLKDRLGRLAPAVRRAMREIEKEAERTRLEAQFIEAQKMEVMGLLAGGVANDFNNILAVIMGYSYLTLRKFGGNEEIRSHLETIRSTAERATGLTRQLLVFSRGHTVQPAVLDLNTVAQELEPMLSRLLDANIALKFDLTPEIGSVKADSGYIGQVLMNLVINARDAMPDGGEIRIATGGAALDENYARAHPRVIPGEYVTLSVSDTGIGMSEETKARVFEAFFTTKPKGGGTGLGLATCQTIVQQSGGHIEVESEPGRGSTFRVYFPHVAQAPAADGPAEPSGPLPQGSETVLLVEEDPGVRHLACDVLQNQGYGVLQASNGLEGLRVARELKGKPIGLVITDVIMSQMGGKVMAEWLQTVHPNMKVLFTSSGGEDAPSHRELLLAGKEFLTKPYKPAALVRKVRALLDSAPSAAPA